MNKLLAVLGIASFSFQKNLFGKNPFVKLDKEQLQKIEAALDEKEPDAELVQKFADSKEKLTGVVNAVEQALDVAEIEGTEDIVGNIVLLGQKCQEYGNSKNRHVFPDNNGKDKKTDDLEEGYMDPNDGHNQIIKELV